MFLNYICTLNRKEIMKRFFLFFLLLQVSQTILAQVFQPELHSTEEKRPEILNHLVVNQDPRVGKMLSWDIKKNKSLDGIEGYRVEIFFSPDADALEKAKEKKLEFLSKYPDIPVHIKYDAPNFRLRVGDFRTKNEALKLYSKIKNAYPVAFIVADDIKFPLLKQEQYE